MDLDLLYTEARAQLDAQLSSFDALDAKVGGVLALGVAEAAIVASALALPHPAGLPEWLVILVGVLSGVSLLAFGVMGVLTGQQLAPVLVDTGADLDDAESDYANGQSDDFVKGSLYQTLRHQYQQNESERYRPKVRALKRSLIALGVQTVVALLALVLLVVPSLSQAAEPNTSGPAQAGSSLASPAPTPAR